jgi:hypothetical protein
MYTTYYDGNWHHAENLIPFFRNNIVVDSTPAVVDSSGFKTLFWKYQGGLYYSTEQGLDAWSRAVQVNVAFTGGSAPAAAIHGNETDVFWKSTDGMADGVLLETFTRGKGWNATIDLSGVSGTMGSPPTVAANPSGEQFVFWKGSGNEDIWEAFWDGKGWNIHQDIGSFLNVSSMHVAGQPAAVWYVKDGHAVQDVYWRGSLDGALYHAWYTQSFWHGPEVVPNTSVMGSDPAVAVWGSLPHIGVFWQGGQGSGYALFEAYGDGHNWVKTDLGQWSGSILGPPAVCAD